MFFVIYGWNQVLKWARRRICDAIHSYELEKYVNIRIENNQPNSLNLIFLFILYNGSYMFRQLYAIIREHLSKQKMLISFKNDVVILKSFVTMVWKTGWMGKIWSVCWFATHLYICEVWNPRSSQRCCWRFKASGLFCIDHWMFQRIIVPLTSGWNVSLVLDCLNLKVDARNVGCYLPNDIA
jgi:hypothetical protein